MSAMKSQEASSSASPFRYDVFLSFRGIDTRKTFTDHLYTALDQAGFHTFRDHVEIGEDIKSKLDKAIRESRMSIIVLSKNYFSSTWCLEELVTILKCRAFGHGVLPVFYDVDPSKVRYEFDRFKEALIWRHEKKLQSETDELAIEKLKDKLQTWRAALSEVASLAGMVLQNGHEARFIQKIIEVVEDNLSRTSLNSATNLVGTLQVNEVQSFNWPRPRLCKLVGISPLFSRAKKSQEASSSASPFSYDVFLSSRGMDTGRTFTDHLYTALYHAGFHTFRDNDEIGGREDINSDPEKVIRESRMSIIVLSKNYASSWCLEELVTILKFRTFGHIVLPVFYDVDPYEVRNQIDSFEEAFRRHEKKLESETDELAKEKLKDKLRTWRAALREVASLAGMVLQDHVNGHEARFIQKIIEAVGDNLSSMSLNSAPNLVGTLQVNAVQSFNWPWPRLHKLVGISPLFSRAKLLHVWPGLNFWYYLAIISSPAWVLSFLAMDFIKKTTDLVFIFLISTLTLSCFAINFMLSQFYFSLPSIPETDRFFRGYQRSGKTIGYTLLFFSNVGLYYFTEKSVACMLTFLFLAFYCLCALFCIQPYTDFGALEFLLNACMNQTLSLFGLRSSYSWLVIIACIVIVGIRFRLEPPEATTDEVDLESDRRNT
ncbi:hypothetical protein RHGRI_014764 [Rhododendron griersonianum]|uniref:ADP-ribosyl cyclase/cyclic ADP-ribose hydrolase n=1 Tax=Rhododendron griersonianum TaxID=479676 RepID=A0AAV6KAP5_9ERIC|nr:hypothetical protein RHGRI_014764 [Rhododendron griersonianum]